MKRVRQHIMLSLIMLLFGCEKEYNWIVKEDGIERIVVDAIITNELKSQVIVLSKTDQELNLPSLPVSGAEVFVSDGTISYVFTESVTNQGSYYSQLFQAAVNKTYQLSILLDNQEYTASSTMESVSQLDELTVVWDSDKSFYRYIPDNQGKPSMTEIYYDWSAVPDYCSEYGFCNAQETFYILDNVDINAEFGPEKQVIYFPAGTILIRRKYSLTEEHQQFIRSLLMETEWRGGLFDVQQGNIPTNLSNEALGYFAVCTVVSDTTLIN
jgi:hypothetical protein